MFFTCSLTLKQGFISSTAVRPQSDPVISLTSKQDFAMSKIQLDTLSSKAPRTPEAQAATTGAAGSTSKGGGGGWKMPNLKYNQSMRNQSNAQNSPS